MSKVTRPLQGRIVRARRVYAYLTLRHIPQQKLARRVPVRALSSLRIENARLILDEIVSRRLGVDSEVGGLGAVALADCVTLLLLGSDVVGAVAGLD